MVKERAIKGRVKWNKINVKGSGTEEPQGRAGSHSHCSNSVEKFWPQENIPR